jgi:hypothetical protein
VLHFYIIPLGHLAHLQSYTQTHNHQLEFNQFKMKFIYASLFCALVSAAPITEPAKPGSEGALAEVVNKLTSATSYLNAIGLKKRDDHETLATRQLGEVTTLLRLLVNSLPEHPPKNAAPDSDGGKHIGGLLRRDEDSQVDKRQIEGAGKLVNQVLSKLLGGGDGGGVNLKRDVELAERKLPDPKTLVQDLLGMFNGKGDFSIKRNAEGKLSDDQLEEVTALLKSVASLSKATPGTSVEDMNL